MLYDSIGIKCPGQANPETANRVVAVWGWGEGKGWERGNKE